MGGRGKDREPGWARDETQCGVKRQQWWNRHGHGLSHIHMWWIKIGRDAMGVSDPSPRPDHTAQGSSTGNVNPHNFWL